MLLFWSSKEQTMKSVISFLMLLCPAAVWAQPILHLTAGQSYSYEFSTVPFVQIGALVRPGGGGFFYFATPHNPGVQVRVEMFENRLDPTPSRTNCVTLGQWAPEVSVGALDSWQDLEGRMRLTVLAGAVDLTGLEVRVFGGPDPALNFAAYGYGQIMPPPPDLRIVREGAASLQITWLTNFADHVLESATSLPAADWSTVTNAAAIVGDHLSVTVGTDASKQFYRLRKP